MNKTVAICVLLVLSGTVHATDKDEWEYGPLIRDNAKEFMWILRNLVIQNQAEFKEGSSPFNFWWRCTDKQTRCFSVRENPEDRYVLPLEFYPISQVSK